MRCRMVAWPRVDRLVLRSSRSVLEPATQGGRWRWVFLIHDNDYHSNTYCTADVPTYSVVWEDHPEL